jgi:hypothetical protein
VKNRQSPLRSIVSLAVLAGCLAVLMRSGFRADARGVAPSPKTADHAWIPLFNGKNLEGWTPKIKGHAAGENYADTFRVEDGILKVSYDKYDKFNEQFGHLFWKNKYSDYRVRVEYRFVGDQCAEGPGWATRNSGLMIHSQSAESMRKDQDFPVSIEVQLLGGLGRGERPTANLCTPGTHVVYKGKLWTDHCTNSKSKTYDGDQWVTLEVEVHGNGTIKHTIDGQTVIEYEKPQFDPGDNDARGLMKTDDPMISEGYLCLQAESHPVEFRKVEILPLKP